jgi:hypothetical protein
MEKCELLTKPERYIPSEDQYLEAFTSIHPTLTSGHQAILAKLYQHCYFMEDNRRIRTWELSDAADYAGDSSGQIGKIGEKFFDFFHLDVVQCVQPSLALVSWFPDETAQYWYIELIPEAARAFKRFLQAERCES